jgi:Uma2 family endonuclease
MGTMLKLTAEDYLALPEGSPRCQLIEGDIIMSPSPRPWHQMVLLRLVKALDNHVSDVAAGQVFISPVDVILDIGNVYQPDILYISKGRKSILREDGIFGAPDICVEILSPSNRQFDLTAKRNVYARSGVVEYWIVDPDAKTVSVYRLQDDATQPVAIFTEAGTLVSPLLPGFEYSVTELFKKD